MERGQLGKYVSCTLINAAKISLISLKKINCHAIWKRGGASHVRLNLRRCTIQSTALLGYLNKLTKTKKVNKDNYHDFK